MNFLKKLRVPRALDFRKIAFLSDDVSITIEPSTERESQEAVVKMTEKNVLNLNLSRVRVAPKPGDGPV
jgi:hypothetical protein